MTNVEWPQEKVDLLKQCRADGMTLRECAEKLGVTRSAISGKMNRLGLCVSMALRPVRRVNIQGDGGLVTKIKCSLRDRKKREAKPPPEPDPVELMPDESLAHHVTLVELTNNTCRWPIGNPGTDAFRFCGATTADLIKHRPYCPYHMRLGRVA